MKGVSSTTAKRFSSTLVYLVSVLTPLGASLSVKDEHEIGPTRCFVPNSLALKSKHRNALRSFPPNKSTWNRFGAGTIDSNAASLLRISKMEQEMEALHRDFKKIEESHGTKVLHLVLAQGYVAKLLGNARVVRYLNMNHADIFAKLQGVCDGSTLES